MSYPADYWDAPPLFMYANNDSDDEADCGGAGYNGDRVDKKFLQKEMLPSIS
jgi:hypothetical protein